MMTRNDQTRDRFKQIFDYFFSNLISLYKNEKTRLSNLIFNPKRIHLRREEGYLAGIFDLNNSKGQALSIVL